jgi:hypothetical protein
LILQKVAEARGRTAEYFGAGTRNANVENDMRIRIYGIRERAVSWYRDGGLFQQLILESFASGVNAYASKFSDSINTRLRQVLPFTPQDALAIAQYTIHFTFLPETSGLLDKLAAWEKNPNAPAVKAAPPQAEVGSNGWALAPSRSADGNAILMGNPHLPWGVNQLAPPFPGKAAADGLSNPQRSRGAFCEAGALLVLASVRSGFNSGLARKHVFVISQRVTPMDLSTYPRNSAGDALPLDPVTTSAGHVRCTASDG